MSAAALFKRLSAARNDPLYAEFSIPNLDAMIVSTAIAAVAERVLAGKDKRR